jgi:hypothetical protein
MNARAKRLLMIFALALGVRLLMYIVYTPPLIGDPREYYINSMSMENTVRLFPYQHWYERTPVYMAFLHFTGRSLLIQILLSALTCVLLELQYRHAGWVYALYLPSIFFANGYLKETLLIFLFVLAVLLLRRHPWWLLLVLPAIFAGFISYGGVMEYNAEFAAGQRSIIYRIYVMWRPEWPFAVLIPHPPEWLATLLRGIYILFYVPLMVIFIRNIRWTDLELWLFAGFVLLAIFSFGNERYREPVMPFLIGYVTPIALYLLQRGYAALRPATRPDPAASERKVS